MIARSNLVVLCYIPGNISSFSQNLLCCCKPLRRLRHARAFTYLLVCVCAFMHFSVYSLYRSISLSFRLHTQWIQLPLVEPEKPRDSANEPAHICLQTICNIFYSGVCSDSTTVFDGNSAPTCVREQA